LLPVLRGRSSGPLTFILGSLSLLMNSFRFFSCWLTLTLGATAFAAGTLTPVDTKTDATWLAKARATYPLDHCIVSDDKFDGGEMGKPQDFVYRAEGQPDRLVRLCCKSCIKDFKKDPDQFVKKIDAAAKAPASAK
jgi:hypothetical protein